MEISVTDTTLVMVVDIINTVSISDVSGTEIKTEHIGNVPHSERGQWVYPVLTS